MRSYFLWPAVLLMWVALGCGNPGGAGSIEEIIAKGWQAFEAGDYVKAEFTFTEVINRDPQNVEGKNGIAWAQAMQRKYEDAIVNWLEAVDLDDSVPDVHAGLCLVYQVQKQFEECIQAGEKALQLAPNYAFAYDQTITANTLRGTMASAYYGLGQYTKAAAMLDSADPANAPHSTDPAELLQAIMAFLGFKK